ncbi:hypothetical protein GCM10023189_23770 [Nibrella saemangeumensis]|uniref:Uncharacterized protein n=1 Tax=Nibrella saemangeumensis TaxID=1084526 RepID=A0ABP8MVW4_9BACT
MNSEEKIELQVRMATLEKKMADINRTINRLESDLQSVQETEEDGSLRAIQEANIESMMIIQQKMLAHVMELYQQAIDESKREEGG